MWGYIRQEETQRIKTHLAAEEIEGLPFLTLHCGQTATRYGRRRVKRGLKKMAEYGVHQVIVPPALEEMSCAAGLIPVRDTSLRQALIEPLLDCFCAQNSLDIYRSTVKLCGREVNQTVRQAAELLAHRARYVQLSIDTGQEKLSEWLRRNYGLSVGNGGRGVLMQVCCDDAHTGELPTLWIGRGCQKHQRVNYRLQEPWRSRIEENVGLFTVLFAEGKLPAEAFAVKSVESYLDRPEETLYNAT